MKKIRVIGDSHTSKVSYLIQDYFREADEEHEFRDSNNEMTKNYYKVFKESFFDGRMYIEADKKIFLRYREGLYEFEDKDYELSFSYHPGASAHVFDYNDYKYMEHWNKKDENIVPFLGYVDVRNFLPKYKNTNLVVKNYIEKTLKKFNNANVVFMEPMPQFITYIINGWRINASDPDIDFETRYEYHYEFIESLKKYSNKYGLQDPISSIDIMNTDMIEPHLQPKKMPVIMNDHLKPHLYKPFIDEILINKKIREC